MIRLQARDRARRGGLDEHGYSTNCEKLVVTRPAPEGLCSFGERDYKDSTKIERQAK